MAVTDTSGSYVACERFVVRLKVAPCTHINYRDIRSITNAQGPSPESDARSSRRRVSIG